LRHKISRHFKQDKGHRTFPCDHIAEWCRRTYNEPSFTDSSIHNERGEFSDQLLRRNMTVEKLLSVLIRGSSSHVLLIVSGRVDHSQLVILPVADRPHKQEVVGMIYILVIRDL
jgi:hypothetical protein